MSKIIACCGLICSDCQTYSATQKDDDSARAKVAAYYAETFHFNLRPEDINCDGCLSNGGRIIAYCRNCEIRKCCREKGFMNCAICEEQPCNKLKKFHEFSPGAKACFETLLKKIHLNSTSVD
jgi:hypothetical protein